MALRFDLNILRMGKPLAVIFRFKELDLQRVAR